MFRLFLSFICFIPCLHAYEYDIAICCIFQNEAPYLKEWIDYHRSIGVNHFYLYNNESTDNYLKVLDPYIKKKIVEVIDWPNPIPLIEFNYGCQTSVYANCIQRVRYHLKWLAIIDTDEFIVPMTCATLKGELDNYPLECVAVYATWATFGTNHKWLMPGESILRNLTKRAPLDHPNNIHGKSIVRPEFVETCVDPHFVVLMEGVHYFDGNQNRRTGGYKDQCLRINHYTYRDESFLRGEKSTRAILWGFNPENLYEQNEEYCQEEDTFILSRLRS